MTTRIFSGLLILTNAYAACVSVAGDRIEARDLGIAALGESREIVGLSPAPGAIRRFSARQISRLLQRLGGADAMAVGVCVVRSVQPLPRGEVMEALTAALGDTRISLELVDYSDAALPTGRLEFRRGGLVRRGGGEPDLWRGRLIYGAGRAVPVLARVHLSIERRAMVASHDLPAGALLSPESLRVESLRMHPFADAVAQYADFDGAVTRRRLLTGTPIRKDDLYMPPLVKSGDRLTLSVQEGATRLTLTVRAESSGREGQQIPVRNLNNGRRFYARVKGKGTAVPIY